jgi:hypothetical protein
MRASPMFTGLRESRSFLAPPMVAVMILNAARSSDLILYNYNSLLSEGPRRNSVCPIQVRSRDT